MIYAYHKLLPDYEDQGNRRVRYGYPSLRHHAKTFKEIRNCTPSEFRSQAGHVGADKGSFDKCELEVDAMTVMRGMKQLQPDTKPYGILEGYIDRVRNRYRVNLNLHDLAGVSTIDPLLEKILSPYLYHNNSFCNFVKKNEKGFAGCVNNKERLCSLCRKRERPFFGRCPMGVEEFVFPVRWGKQLIAILCVGQFFHSRERSLARIRRKAAEYGMEPETSSQLFLDTARAVDVPINELLVDIGMLGDYLSLLYRNFVGGSAASAGVTDGAERTASDHRNNHIVNNTLRFIRDNLYRELSLKVLAANSYCNPSYLSHIFKERMQVNIIDYINQARIDAARQLLDTTPLSITEIGLKVGFNDSGYFSRVFRSLTGTSPREYRERNT